MAAPFFCLCGSFFGKAGRPKCVPRSAPVFDNRVRFQAGVAYWLGPGSPVRSTEFDSPRPLQITPGRPLRSRRQSEKLEKHVRLVPLAPGGDRGRVAQACDCGSHYESSILSGHPIFHWEVAKPVRRLILNQIMRRFESSPPSHGRVADWQGTALSMQIKRVQFSPRSPFFAESPSW